MTDDNKTVPFDEFSKVQQNYQAADERAKRFEGQLADVQKQMERFKDIDPEKYKATVEELEIVKRENASKGKPEDLEAWQKEKEAELRGKLQKDIDARDQELGSLRTKYHQLRVVDKFMSTAGSEFKSDLADIARDIVSRQANLNDANEWEFKDENGNLLYEPGQASKPMTPQGFVTLLKEKRPSLFNSSVKPGVRAPGEKSDSKPISVDLQSYQRATPEQRANIPLAERAKLAQETARTMKIGRG
jgi:hypothetical protein